MRFDEIPAEGREFDITDVSWFPGDELRAVGPVRARILLERRGARVFFQGGLAGVVRLTCDRCLEEYDFALDHQFRIDLELVDENEALQAAEREHACQDSEMDVMFLDAPLIDLGEILAQQVFLMLPAKRLCREDCQGLCPRCGINRNQGRCACAGQDEASPFAVLRNLKH
ncbi:MAG: DUF177 domain-containing protein [Thermodesulfobacteriota bacterium]